MRRKLGTITTPENFNEIINLLDQKGLPMPRPEIANWVQEVFEVKEQDNKLESMIILDDDNEYADDIDDLRMK